MRSSSTFDLDTPPWLPSLFAPTLPARTRPVHPPQSAPRKNPTLYTFGRALSLKVGFRFVKSGRVLRVARLARFARALRGCKLQSLADVDKDYRLTGKERIGMQRFHIWAPKDVDKVLTFPKKALVV